MKLTKLTTMIAGLLFAASASAGNPNDIYLGEPGYAGSGCPAGSASAVLSPDKKTLSVLFDEYVAEAGGSTGKTIDRKSCNLAIPVHVPQGLSISLLKVDYRGYTYLPKRSMARFNVNYFFAGARGPRLGKTFNARRSTIDDEYTYTNKLIATAWTWSPCGRDVNLRINSSMMVRNSNRRSEALATVDSADLSAGILYKIQWRRCWN